jgi:glycosyltransferase involved in cell wall biosynthesis
MKVVHIISGLGIGGAELMLARLISGATEDTQHYVISLTDVGPVGNELRAKGVSVHALGVKYTLGIVFALVSLVRLIRQIRPDIVQTWMYHADLVGGLAARAAGVTRIIWGVRTTDISVGAARSTIVTRWICARLSAIIPTCIVCAAEASRIAHARLGYAASRMVVIPNGFDVEKLSVPATASAKFRASNDLPADALLVGCVGRFHPVKDHRNFVLAAAQIASEYQKALFVMIGRDLDWANTELVGWIGGTGFKDRFR